MIDPAQKAPEDRLVISQEGNLLLCTLNRPHVLNAVDAELHDALERLFADLARRDDVDVVLVTGAGRGFCAGGDISGMADGLTAHDRPGGMFTRGALRLIRNLVDVPQIVVAHVNGPAIGLGATLALLCDIVIASESAVFSDPHVSVGLVAGDGGAVIWPMLIGLNRAKELLLTGDKLTAQQAVDMGLVNHTYPSDEAGRQARALADRLAAGAPAALRWTKASLNRPLRQQVELVLEASLALEGLTALTEDHREGVRAALDGRSPRFGHH